MSFCLTKIGAVARVVEFLWAASIVGSADAQIVDDTRRASTKYSEAFLHRDMATIVSMTDPLVLERLGGESKAPDELKRVYDTDVDSDVDRGLFPSSERIEEIRTFRDDRRAVFFVKTSRLIDSFPQSMRDSQLYVVSTTNKGETWEVIDLSCISMEWIHALAPTFKNVLL